METLIRVAFSDLTGPGLEAVFSDRTRRKLPPGLLCHHFPADPERPGRETEHYRLYHADPALRKFVALPVGMSAAHLDDALAYLLQ